MLQEDALTASTTRHRTCGMCAVRLCVCASGSLLATAMLTVVKKEGGEQVLTLERGELEEARSEIAQLQARVKEQSPAPDEDSDLLACVFKVISAVKKSPDLERMLLHALGK